jgi:indole-3-glycerol phosphate synthase
MTQPPKTRPPTTEPATTEGAKRAAETTVADILARIVERRRRRVEASGSAFGSLPDAAPEECRALRHDANPFLTAIARHRGRAVIAEVKMGSPSLGPLSGRFDPVAVARSYAAAGAAALSVVVEPDFFYGSFDLLRGCRDASGLPTIAKDFVVDPVQLDWAREAGADAILLVASLYTPGQLRAYARAARVRGLVPLVEIHGLGELSTLQGAPWELVGVNNRNLRTFQVAVENSLALASTLPTGSLKVAESGISGAAELSLLRGVGYDAFLVGESLLLSPDPEAKLRELLG